MSADGAFLVERASGAAAAVSSTSAAANRRSLLRYSRWDTWLIGLALLHGLLLVLAPSLPLVALGLWWNGNTISHNFVHLPFFRSRLFNVLFSSYLTLLLGFPQSLWAARHLAHHREESFQWTPVRGSWLAEAGLVLTLWTILFGSAPDFFLQVYLPGWLLGLGLCRVQGIFEHARGTTSHHGWIYNRLFFNDGYHREHHASPTRHWRSLPDRPADTAASNLSRWPAVLRWLEYLSLDGLESLVCRSRWLQRFVLNAHERALTRLLADGPLPRRVVIVGGGFFPRTALALRRIVPEATLVIVDMREDRLERAKTWIREGVEFVRGYCTSENLSACVGDADLAVVPLALRGSREGFYRKPPVSRVLIHDWVWRRRGRGVVVQWLMLKRINLVER